MRLAQAEQGLPEPERVLRLDPELIAQIAGEAGAVDAHPTAVDLGLDNPEMGQGLDARDAHGQQDVTRGGALEGEAAEAVADLLDRHIEAIGGFGQPVQLMQRGVQDEIALAEAEDRAFLDHPPVIVAPGGIGDLHRLDLGHVAGDQEIDEARRVAAADGIFDQRRDVIDRGAVADGEIFRLLGIEEGGRLEAHPTDPALAMHQLLDGRMEGRLAQEGRADAGHGSCGTPAVRLHLLQYLARRIGARQARDIAAGMGAGPAKPEARDAACGIADSAARGAGRTSGPRSPRHDATGRRSAHIAPPDPGASGPRRR